MQSLSRTLARIIIVTGQNRCHEPFRLSYRYISQKPNLSDDDSQKFREIVRNAFNTYPEHASSILTQELQFKDRALVVSKLTGQTSNLTSDYTDMLFSVCHCVTCRVIFRSETYACTDLPEHHVLLSCSNQIKTKMEHYQGVCTCASHLQIPISERHVSPDAAQHSMFDNPTDKSPQYPALLRHGTTPAAIMRSDFYRGRN